MRDLHKVYALMQRASYVKDLDQMHLTDAVTKKRQTVTNNSQQITWWLQLTEHLTATDILQLQQTVLYTLVVFIWKCAYFCVLVGKLPIFPVNGKC